MEEEVRRKSIVEGGRGKRIVAREKQNQDGRGLDNQNQNEIKTGG